jgi:hypothetical protein
MSRPRIEIPVNLRRNAVKTEHQQHAAQCRHAKASKAKRIYAQELSEYFKDYSARHPSLFLKERLNTFSSICRGKIRDSVSRFGFKESTFHTWLREWKTLTYSSDLDY